MKIFLKYEFWSLTVGLNLLKVFGFLVPGTHSRYMEIFLWAYWFFWVIFLVGIYIVIQFGDLLQIWGDITLMVSSSFLLLTNIAFAAKIYVFRMRREAVLKIIDEGDQELRDEDRAEGRDIINVSDRETALLYRLFIIFTAVTTGGWVASAEKNGLPFRAWYPYDEYKSPAYEITYIHQSVAIFLMGAINISIDSIISSLMAVCRCRMRLLNLSIRNLCSGLHLREILTFEQEEIVSARLRDCVLRHQAALRSANEIQACFTELILGQFTVSMAIICVSAYELTVNLHNESKNIVHIVAMIAYLQGMILQVFLYCYQGDQLASESSEIANAAYQCEWYKCSLKFRRALLVVMVRSRRVAQLTAGGFTNLSLECFTSIMKASYTFFTVLQQVDR